MIKSPFVLLLIGDSLAVGLEQPLKKIAGELGITFYARGIVGSSATQWAGDLLQETIDTMASWPDMVLVSLGGNDYGRSDPENVAAAVREIRDQLCAAGRPKIVWLEPPALPFPDKTGAAAMWLDAAHAHFSPVELAIPRQADGIHPTAAGYRTWAAALMPWALQEAGASAWLPAVRGLETTTTAFRRRLIETALRFNLNPGFLCAVISFESAGTFRPDIKNPFSGFVGLIQFGPLSAKATGTTMARLGNMTAVEQLEYVGRHYRATGRTVRTLCDHYLAVFAPAFIGAAPETPVYKAPTKAYEQNKRLDSAKKGYVSVADACGRVAAIYGAATKREPIEVSFAPTCGDRLAMLGLLAALGAGLAAGARML